MTCQPNSDDAHEHTYPVQGEGLRAETDRERAITADLTTRLTQMERRLTHLENAVHIYLNRNENDDQE